MSTRKGSLAALGGSFADAFGGEGELLFSVAPGRVNIIGEHTDYNGGPVMPLAIDMCVELAFRKRDDRKVVLRSTTQGDPVEFFLDDLESMKEKGWGAYAAGVCFMLGKAGVEPCGMDGMVGGNLPVGIGLSSSAALEVAAAAAQLHLASAKMERLEIARVCQMAEHEFAGVKCGIMDQFAAVMGSRKGPNYLNCSTMEYKELPFPRGLSVVLCDTGVKHELGASEYNRRREECEEALSIMKEHVKGLTCLAELPLGEFRLLKHHLREKVARRAEHVVTETRRTFEAAKALASSNPLQLGVLMNASHESLRDHYEVSCPELDTLARAAWEADGVYGSRMTGGGFGGCTVTVADSGKVETLAEVLKEAYTEAFGREPGIYVCGPQRGAYVTRLKEGES